MKTWFITGVSSGLGLAMAEAALNKGYRVVGTLRTEEQRAAFSGSHPNAVGVLLDVTDHDSVKRVVASIERDVGAIDILVNNAGYGYEGTIEEATMEDIRSQFEVNVFGTFAVTQAVLPLMRQRRSGHILTVTSIGGIVTFPGVGIYNSSKFALEGFSEALSKEVADFGIRVTAIEPGMFRTDWAGRSMTRGESKLTDYDALFAPIRQARLERNGKQQGDPRKAAVAIIAAVEAEKAPVHLLLGSDALSFARTKLAGLKEEFDGWAAVTSSTNFE
ncbi:NADP-dependent 3-hydroxy acid dehydrogenase YdfG [Collimonas sp. OK242]|jgi:NAD(P)-dependent dehydrogenase (short-subunit alcohol dehydrogenase family)|uniref:oxidoreductase n=1 Tax=Collimonas sp. OK242 TaxID=1798195 RepID=UPI000894A3E0|nr:oxidoreductase [Collimonas sp. OK242]SDY64210.1 NADP-dependent 3-hydroxy acid dehydrogenase YdfG [Collimonas sp. OK242]